MLAEQDPIHKALTSLLGRFNIQVPEGTFFIDNLLVRIHSIIEMISADRPCAMGV